MTPRLLRLFLLLTLIGPLHMAEQLLTGIEEFYAIRESIGRYYAWFSAANADRATVLLITIVWTKVSLIFYALMRGGAAALAVVGVFGLFAVSELHHVLEVIAQGAYDPGVLTCLPYAWVGAQMVAETWREYKRRHLRDAVEIGFSNI